MSSTSKKRRQAQQKVKPASKPELEPIQPQLASVASHSAELVENAALPAETQRAAEQERAMQNPDELDFGLAASFEPDFRETDFRGPDNGATLEMPLEMAQAEESQNVQFAAGAQDYALLQPTHSISNATPNDRLSVNAGAPNAGQASAVSRPAFSSPARAAEADLAEPVASSTLQNNFSENQISSQMNAYTNTSSVASGKWAQSSSAPNSKNPAGQGAGSATGSGEERLGDILRRVREHKRENLAEVSEYLRIRPSFLDAIEKSRYADLPADAYVIGFVRTYANYLGLDGKAAIDQYRKEMEGRRKRPHLSMPQPVYEGRTPSVAILIVAILLALLIYVAWYSFSAADRTSLGSAQLTETEGPEGTLATTSAATTSVASSSGNVGAGGYGAANSDGSNAGGAAGYAGGAALTLPNQPSAQLSAAPSNAMISATATMPATSSITANNAQSGSGAVGSAYAGTSGAAANSGDVAANHQGGAAASAAVPVGSVQNTVNSAGGVNSAGSGVALPASSIAGASVSGSAVSGIALGDKAATNAALNNQPAGTSGATGAGEPTPSALPSAGQSNLTNGLYIRAEKQSWVLVFDKRGGTIYDHIMKAGEVYKVPGIAGLRLTTGNGAGITLVLNGQDLPKLSQSSGIVRNVALDGQMAAGRNKAAE